MTPPSPRPGSPVPPGAHWDGSGTSFALRSATADAVDLCLFDLAGVERRLPLTERTGDVWHGYAAGVGPGQLYGFRVTGPFEPSSGLRHNPSKLLLDPYALAVSGELGLHESVFGSRPGQDRVPDLQDSAPCVPRSVVVDEDFAWGGDRRPATPWRDSIVYELHVKGFTARHPGVPERLRGTYAGLASPAALGHLLDLGVTAVELLPVHQFVSEPHLLRRGLTNYWGYAPVGYFAPHAAYSAAGSRGEQVAEFKSMVRSLHAAGLEVLLDVVYNHTGEGDATGPTLAHRGIDNTGYYRLDPADRSRYADVTGTGNTLDLRAPAALAMVLDSLRYWVDEMHVDGFRFDLASALVRGDDGVDLSCPFLALVAHDPVLSQVKLIAEPWDLGPGGYLVGRFPPPWAEWNDRFRDGARDCWRGHGEGLRDLAFRLSGSSDVFGASSRPPTASVNFVTAHDGFTLHDLTAYDRKHNAANGEQGRDGESHNRSWNCGVEGPTDDPEIDRLRRRQARNLLTTLLLSTGTPMLSMGDEVRRTQLGNNNAYCQDGPLSWQPWDLAPDAEHLREFTCQLVHLRRAHPVLRQDGFFLGRPDAHGVKDLAWFGVDGNELTEAQWHDASQRTIGMYLDGRAERLRPAGGQPVPDATFLLVLHISPVPTSVVLPGRPWAQSWTVLLDTARETPLPDAAPAPASVRLEGFSAVLLRAERPA